MDIYQKITKDVTEIQAIVTEMKQDLQGLKTVHTGFATILMELELLTINLEAVKKQLN